MKKESKEERKRERERAKEKAMPTLVLLTHHEDVDDFSPNAKRIPEIGFDDGAVERPHVNDGRRLETVLLAAAVALVRQCFIPGSLHLSRQQRQKRGIDSLLASLYIYIVCYTSI